MEANKSKLKLIVSSRKVLVRIEGFDVHVDDGRGYSYRGLKRALVYDYVLDDEQTRAMKEAKELARRTGMRLEVTDLTRSNFLKRLLVTGPRGFLQGRTLAGARPDKGPSALSTARSLWHPQG